MFVCEAGLSVCLACVRTQFGGGLVAWNCADLTVKDSSFQVGAIVQRPCNPTRGMKSAFTLARTSPC